MCGIVGFNAGASGQQISESKLRSMCNLMEHRGPDDHGLYMKDNTGLGHRRLSIIDLNSGHQPMMSDDGRYIIVFNGEIYNFRELRHDLEMKGVVFNTHSDTEVLLKLYIYYGKGAVKYLNGIFAFAVWDAYESVLFLARDHIGIKPLYYAVQNGVFIFASEMKCIIDSGLTDASVNIELVPEYFTFRHISGEKTLFEGINSLLPGHSITVKDGEPVIECYWSPITSCEPVNLGFQDAVEKLEYLLMDATKLQMVSDVPLGTFCSGGIDSSLVTALAAKNSGSNINTFSVGFHESDYDETEYARMVSERYNTNHHELKLTNTDFTGLLSEMIWHNDEPLNFSNSVHIYALSKLAKNHVTVVLTGEGADELFGGYPRYHIARYIERIRHIPGPVKRIMSGLLSLSSDHRLQKLSSYFTKTLSETILFNCATTNERDYYTNTLPASPGYRQQLMDRTQGFGALKQVSLLDQHTYLLSILNRQDKMSMAASIESRVPILDYRLIEFANSLPDSYKQKGTQTKIMLKKVAEKYLPHEVIYRRKSGFGVPLADWFKQENGLGGLAADTFNSVSLEEVGKKKNFADVLSEHQQGTADNAEFLWTALNYALWKKSFNIS